VNNQQERSADGFCADKNGCNPQIPAKGGKKKGPGGPRTDSQADDRDSGSRDKANSIEAVGAGEAVAGSVCDNRISNLQGFARGPAPVAARRARPARPRSDRPPQNQPEPQLPAHSPLDEPRAGPWRCKTLFPEEAKVTRPWTENRLLLRLRTPRAPSRRLISRHQKEMGKIIARRLPQAGADRAEPG